MSAKLHIDLKLGLLDVEGSEELVRSIYDDFKSRLTAAAAAGAAQVVPKAPAQAGNGGEPAKRPSRTAKRNEFTPEFNPNLDTAKLPAYYGQFDVKNHPEKILVFASFMKDGLSTHPCSANDIFTCYQAMRTETKTPKAFAQALRDAVKAHMIEAPSWDEISIPISGSNYFHHDLKRKGAE